MNSRLGTRVAKIR